MAWPPVPSLAKPNCWGAFLQERGQTLHRIDFNDGGFSHLTVSRQIRQVSARIAQEERVVLIGSSLGGLTAAWVAQESLMVERLVLLAPAFGFPDCWLTGGGVGGVATVGRSPDLPLWPGAIAPPKVSLRRGCTNLAATPSHPSRPHHHHPRPSG